MTCNPSNIPQALTCSTRAFAFAGAVVVAIVIIAIRACSSFAEEDVLAVASFGRCHDCSKGNKMEQLTDVTNPKP